MLERAFDPLGQLRLLGLAERVPRRRVRPPHRDHREPVEFDGVVLVDGLDDLRPSEDVVDLEHVVVRRAGDRPDPRPRESLLGHGDPPLGPLDHDLLEALVDEILVLLQRDVLLVGHADRVVPAVHDALFELDDLGLGLERLSVVLQRRLPAAVGALDDGDHGLAGDVAAENDHVGLVELTGVQELLPADLRAVEIRDVEDLGHLSRPQRQSWLGRPTCATEVAGVDNPLSGRPPREGRTTEHGLRRGP